jgi:hypothetical protein
LLRFLLFVFERFDLVFDKVYRRIFCFHKSKDVATMPNEKS